MSSTMMKVAHRLKADITAEETKTFQTVMTEEYFRAKTNVKVLKRDHLEGEPKSSVLLYKENIFTSTSKQANFQLFNGY